MSANPAHMPADLEFDEPAGSFERSTRRVRKLGQLWLGEPLVEASRPLRYSVQCSKHSIVAAMNGTTTTQPRYKILGLDHVVIRVRDIDISMAFYCGLLGCTEERRVDSVGLVQLRAGTSLIDLVDLNSTLGKQGGPAPGSNGKNMDHFCIRIEPFDSAAIREMLQKHGLSHSEFTTRYGADGNGPSVYVNDPDGNTVELKGPSDITV